MMILSEENNRIKKGLKGKRLTCELSFNTHT